MASNTLIASFQKSKELTVAPAFLRLPPPIILIGMHRSGTSLAAGLLSMLGVYMDPAFYKASTQSNNPGLNDAMRKYGYGEAVCFRLLNEEIMARAGADWRCPKPLLEQRTKANFNKYATKVFRTATFTTLNNEFLAPLPADFSGVWGWKDPRNSLTLPFWLNLFPNARILHIRRNTEAIADSLMRRTLADAGKPTAPPSYLARLKRICNSPEVAVRAVGRRLRYSPTSTAKPYNMSVEAECLQLSKEYLDCSLAYRELPNPYHEVWYEDIITNPKEALTNLAFWAGILPSETQMSQAIQFIQPRT